GAAPRAAAPPPPPPPVPDAPQPPAPPACVPPAEDQQADAAVVAGPESKAGADPLAPGSGLTDPVIDGPHVAGSGLNVPDKVSQGLSPRAYIYTDRPAYRPGQQVALRGVVREVKDGQYANTPKAVYKLEVTDSRGRQIVAQEDTLSDFGTFHQTVPLDPGPARVGRHHPAAGGFAGQVGVQSYGLESIALSCDLKKPVVFRGETVEADVVARYQYGAPAAGRPVAVRLPDGRVVRGSTDASG